MPQLNGLVADTQGRICRELWLQLDCACFNIAQGLEHLGGRISRDELAAIYAMTARDLRRHFASAGVEL